MVTVIVIAAAIAGVTLYGLLASVVGPQEPSQFDVSLPNPMGGPAKIAPGEPTGEITFGGLTVSGSEVPMGDVALGITYVPSWQVDNPTDAAVHVTGNFTASAAA